MMVQDIDGVTVIVNERYYRHLQLSGVVDLMSWAPVPWRALNIHLGPASADAPGIISYLSSMLSERNVSILNFSTFEADLILVQEFDLTKARELLFELGRDGVLGLKEQIAVKTEAHTAEGKLDNAGRRSASLSPSKRAHGRIPSGCLNGSDSGSNLDASVLRARESGVGKARSCSVSSESTLKAALNIVQSPLVLVCVQRAMLKQTMFSLMKQLSRNIDVQLSLESETIRGEPRKHGLDVSALNKDYLWAYFSTNEEISMLLDERDLKDFPEDSLVICPQRWKAIRLVGKAIPFNETGVVKLMSSPYELGIQLLNMSTYMTNVTLVAEHEVETAIQRLRSELNGQATEVIGSYYSPDKVARDEQKFPVPLGGTHLLRPLGAFS
jgi:hypothetical protein